MSAFTDTSLLMLQTRATSLTRRDCYDMTEQECRDLIAMHEPVDPALTLRTIDRAFDAMFGGGREP